MKFRPCIDLHDGKVKQIVGSTLKDDGSVSTNFVSEKSPEYYARMYAKDGLKGGHVIMLGAGNEEAAREALGAVPGTLQVGGGIKPHNARQWLEAGASHVIVTSWLFEDGEFEQERLKQMSSTVGREHLVVDLSCIAVDGEYHVACNRWQTICRCTLSADFLSCMAEYCDEILVHAVGNEGKQAGIDCTLVGRLAEWSPVPATYAGGIATLDDIEKICLHGNGRVDFTVGSALDIFGGRLRYAELAKQFG